MYANKVGYGPRIDYRHCKGCGTCYDNCPMDVFAWDEEKQMPVVAYPAECTICCFCETTCPEVAIDVAIPVHHLLDFGIRLTQMNRKSRFLGAS
ncbi:MAG: ferredoxin family protein [Clostridia bacterium]|nr:ferredoxin family protein [Clostridia bacterium]MDH7573533.1 ferredoxin family protein [Clostridia bacterium]